MTGRFISPIVSIAIFFTISCANPRHLSGPIDRTQLFPNGTYKHNVRVSIPSQKKVFRLQGVVRLDPNSIRLYALSPFGTTVFRIADDRMAKTTKTEIFMDELKPHEKEIKDFYEVVRVMLTTLAITSQQRTYPIHLQDGEASFEIKKFDTNGLPEKLMIIHPRFSADILVTGYDL